MQPSRDDSVRPSWWDRIRFVLGIMLAVAVLAGLAETYLRWFPPSDLNTYLGEESPLTGVLAPDPDFAMTYTSWDAFLSQNGERLQRYLPLESRPEGRPLWAFFGNSFVQAPGMLGDTATRELPDHTIFYLARNEHPPLRMAQIKLLLERGFRPDRIVFVVLPVDVTGLGAHPLSTYHINQRGALTYRIPNRSRLVDWWTQETRLGLTACVRSGWHKGNLGFKPGVLYRSVADSLKSDLTFLFSNLARIARAHDVPVTVLLIPDYYQTCRNRPYAFQDFMKEMLAREGFDVCDLRATFRAESNREGLFIPDRHFSDRGNQVLFHGLMRHFQSGTHPVNATPTEKVP